MKWPVGAKIHIDNKRVFLISEFLLSGIHYSIGVSNLVFVVEKVFNKSPVAFARGAFDCVCWALWSGNLKSAWFGMVRGYYLGLRTKNSSATLSRTSFFLVGAFSFKKNARHLQWPFFFRLTLIRPLFRETPETTKAKCQVRPMQILCKGSPFHFYLLKVTYKTGRD